MVAAINLIFQAAFSNKLRHQKVNHLLRNLLVMCLAVFITERALKADELVIHGTTIGAPTLNRPTTQGIQNYPNSSVYQADSAPYSIIPFYTDTSEHLHIAAYASNFIGVRGIWDDFVGLYQGSFNPLMPLNNLVFFNDDISLNGIRAAGNPSNFDSVANAQYFVVVTGVSGASGVYTLQLASHGHIWAGLINSSIPEPLTWSLMLVGFGIVGLGMRRRIRSEVDFIPS